MNKSTFLWLTLLLLTAACQSTTTPPTATLVIPTAISQPPDSPRLTATPATLPASPTSTLPPAVVVDPSATPVTEPVSPTAVAAPATTEPAPTTPPPPAATYRVAFVAADDTLNVRGGPGVANAVVGELAPDADDVVITGSGQVVAGSTWAPIRRGGLEGWVNGRFLTTDIDNETFCRQTAVTDLLGRLQTAVANRDGAALAALVHPERGLRLRHDWWNREIRLDQAAVTAVFSSDQRYEWGYQDGSGEPIVGAFRDILLPKLDNHLLNAPESACNEILNGGSAGFIRLPDEYEGINFYSFYRPGTEEYGGLDWGSWVVGTEQWEGVFYLSFLIHYDWEI